MTITLFFIASQAASTGQRIKIDAKPGQSLMQAAVAAGIDGIEADCGGLMTCATCHVHVAPSWRDRLGAPDSDELAMLDFTAAPRSEGSRLSCQIRLTPELDGLTVELPPTQH